MSWFEIISEVILGGLFWLWFNSTRVHEIDSSLGRALVGGVTQKVMELSEKPVFVVNLTDKPE